jgi:hypothetical protein
LLSLGKLFSQPGERETERLQNLKDNTEHQTHVQELSKERGEQVRYTDPANKYKGRFEVHTAARMKMAVFWVVATCSLAEVY